MIDRPPFREPLPFTTDPDPTGPEALPPTSDERVLARQHLLSAAASPEPALQEAFVAAAEGRRDPTLLPLVRLIAPDSRAVGVLERELAHWSSGELVGGLHELWDAMCAEQWISDHGLCRSIKLAFTTGRSAIIEGDDRTLRAVLSALLVNVGASRGRGVRPEAYIVVKGGIDAILARI